MTENEARRQLVEKVGQHADRPELIRATVNHFTKIEQEDALAGAIVGAPADPEAFG